MSAELRNNYRGTGTYIIPIDELEEQQVQEGNTWR